MELAIERRVQEAPHSSEGGARAAARLLLFLCLPLEPLFCVGRFMKLISEGRKGGAEAAARGGGHPSARKHTKHREQIAPHTIS